MIGQALRSHGWRTVMKRHKHRASYFPGLACVVGAVLAFVSVMVAVCIVFTPWGRRTAVLAFGKWVSPYAR